MKKTSEKKLNLGKIKIASLNKYNQQAMQGGGKSYLVICHTITCQHSNNNFAVCHTDVCEFHW